MMLDPFLRVRQLIVGEGVGLMCRQCVADSPPASGVSALAKRVFNGLQEMISKRSTNPILDNKKSQYFFQFQGKSSSRSCVFLQSGIRVKMSV